MWVTCTGLLSNSGRDRGMTKGSVSRVSAMSQMDVGQVHVSQSTLLRVWNSETESCGLVECARMLWKVLARSRTCRSLVSVSKRRTRRFCE